MSLNFRLGKIKNWQTVCYRDFDGPEVRLKGLTETIGWLMLPTMMNEITEKNHIEVYRRFHLYETTFGAFRRTEKEDVYVTLADVKMHIGLTTNITEAKPAAFHKAVLERLIRDNDGVVAKHIKELHDDNQN